MITQRRKRGLLLVQLVREAGRHPSSYRRLLERIGDVVDLRMIPPSLEATDWTPADLPEWTGQRGVRVAVVVAGELVHVVNGEELRKL